jgi:hypothetical protein
MCALSLLNVKGMSHRVIMVDPALAAAPKAVREEARRRFEEIAEGVGGIPADSAFWASVKVSRLCLVVSGWSFFYTLEGETLRVTELRGKK